jgi:phospholipid/cholesterol/gamma-HCH transport system substrate-binding protein
MSAYQRNVLVGAVVLVGLGMLAWMILQFANKAASFFLTSGTPITFTTSAAGGLSDGSPVTYKGVNVGRVTGVRRVANPADGEDIVVDAIIDANPPLPANLVGTIKQTSLLGGSAMIELEPDAIAVTRPSLATAGGYLSEGANLRAESQADITSLGGDIRELSQSMRTTVSSINKIIGDPKIQEDIKVSLANARTTLESASRVAAKLEQISVNIDKTAASIDKAAASAGETVGEVRVTVKDARGEIKRVSDNMNQRLEQLAGSLQHVQSITQKLDQGKGTAGQLLNDPKLYQSLADTAAELNLMVKDMRRLVQQWEQEGIIKL